mmetsp:Transcript_20606/g.37230  ORF Transcript_20606/g.37230 Transcript_20606/m.37230 type:complete len:321 (+) Transcript_20606:125-1087(+)
MLLFQHSARQLRRVAPFLEKQCCLSCRNSLAKTSIITPSFPPSRYFTNNTPALLASSNNNPTPDEILSSFANLDHRRASRTGFPEAVFGQGKTPTQIHSILDSMAKNVNEQIGDADENNNAVSTVSTAIIATRVDRDIFDAVVEIGPLEHGVMEYHDTARIISVRANVLMKNDTDTKKHDANTSQQSVVVACAGTTDLPVAEEAALTLSLSGIPVIRIYDCGVAGLHRIISALPKLRHPNVGCVIVCAGMDGALPSVVGGLVDVPVVAIPTSVGYGMSLGGVSALLTMLNSCSPGVGVVNIDNGFGGAVWAMKCLNSRQK